MVLFAAIALGLIIGLLSGGSFSGFSAAANRFNYLPVMFAGAIIQVLIFTPPIGTTDLVHDIGPYLYLLSISLTLFFLVTNRHIPGLKIVLVGAALNAAAIFANGGYMPTTEHALREAGRIDNVVAEEPDERLTHTNSVIAADDAHLIWDRDTPLLILGDMIALPSAFPLANVISIGDILIAIGATVAVVCVMRQKPNPKTPTPDHPVESEGSISKRDFD